MEKKHYLIEVDEGIEPYVHGPFKTEDECDEEARQIRRTQGMDDLLFWADVDEVRSPNRRLVHGRVLPRRIYRW